MSSYTFLGKVQTTGKFGKQIGNNGWEKNYKTKERNLGLQREEGEFGTQ